MRYRIVYERASRNYAAYSPDLPGCVATGATLDECRILMREAIALHLEHSRKYGDPVPPDPTGYVETLDFEPTPKHPARGAARPAKRKRQRSNA